MTDKIHRGNGGPASALKPRPAAPPVRLLPVSDEERRARVARWQETVRELGEMIDETDTPELWDEVMRELGVDPATGGGLGS
jgi:hypothetical protein